MLSPAKITWRKHQKGRLKGEATRGHELAFGTCGLKAMQPVRLKARQIEAGRVVMNRFLKRKNQVFVRVFPDLPVTKKPAEVRMGSGKGGVEDYRARVYPGTIVYEIKADTPEDLTNACEALRKAGAKMPFTWKIVRADQMAQSIAHTEKLDKEVVID